MKQNSIAKQAFWFSIINYFGVVIGVVSTLFVYPYDKEFLGLVRYVDSMAQLLYPMMVFGGSQALVHFYPNLDETNKKRLFKYGITTILCTGFALLILLLIGKPMSGWGHYNYLFYAFPMAFVLAFVELFKRQAANLEKLEMPTLYEKILPKISLPLVFGLLIFGYLEKMDALMVFIGSYFVLLLLLILYLRRHYKLGIGYNFKPLFNEVPKKEYYKYSFYAFLASFGSLLAFRIDALMIPEFLSFEANGTFNIGVALATALAIPATGLFVIYAPKISSYIKNDELSELKKKYIETAKFLFFIGALLYTSVVLGIDSLFRMLPTYGNLVDSIPIIIVLGANVLFNMSTGFNSEIISYSKYYKFNIHSILALAFLNVSLNLLFLTQTHLGILGVAYASLIAMCSFNCFKLYFIYKKMGMLPFDRNYLKLFLIVGFVFLSFYFLPDNSNAILNLILKVGLNALVIMVIAYRLKLVYSFNYWVEKVVGIK